MKTVELDIEMKLDGYPPMTHTEIAHAVAEWMTRRFTSAPGEPPPEVTITSREITPGHARPVASNNKMLGRNQIGILKAMANFGYWYWGSGWIWTNRSETMSLLDSLARRGLVTRSERKYQDSPRYDITEDGRLEVQQRFGPRIAGLLPEQIAARGAKGTS